MSTDVTEAKPAASAGREAKTAARAGADAKPATGAGAEAKPATGAGLTELVGRTVEVISMEGHDRYTDVGILESFETPWLNVRKKNSDLLCFSVYNIRLVKPVGK